MVGALIPYLVSQNIHIVYIYDFVFIYNYIFLFGSKIFLYQVYIWLHCSNRDRSTVKISRSLFWGVGATLKAFGF